MEKSNHPFFLGVIAMMVISRILHMVGMDFLERGIVYGIGAVYAVLANFDYYSKVVLGKNGWWW